jgi:hypothetical protein
MNLAAGKQAGIAVGAFRIHPFQRFVKPDGERNFAAIDSAIFDPTLQGQERCSSKELITFSLKQESFRMGRSPTVSNIPLPDSGDGCRRW